MKVSVIVTTYKDLLSLGFILDALVLQNYDDFEVVIAEDDNSNETVEYLKNYSSLNIKHISHKDVGRTKTVIQNKAVMVSSGEYLIFLDGDVIPYSKLISSQVSIAKKRQVLAGRRVNLTKELTQKIKDKKINPSEIEKKYLLYALKFMFEKSIRFEQGFYISPNSWIYKQFILKRKRSSSILGCNFSCYKEDLLAINGFDESYEPYTFGDDMDLSWRFLSSGCTLLSSKNIANVLHLYHPVSRGKVSEEVRQKYYNNKKANIFITKNGIEKL